MKRTSSNSPRSAWWTWHISAPILCVVFLSLSSQFHIRLALSRSLLQYLSPSWPIPQHPHQTPSLSPGSTNVVVIQNQVCQGRVVLQSFCQSLTADKDEENTWWNHLRFIEIHAKEISTPSTAFLSYFRSYSHIIWSPMKWNEQAQIHSDLHDGLGTSQHQSCSLPFTHVTISPSTSSVWIHIALPPPLMTDSSASSPSWPNTKPEPLQGRWCCMPNSGLSGSSSASVPLPMPDSKQRCAKYVVKSSKILWNSHTRNLNAFYRMLSYFLWYSHVMWSPMKWKEQAQVHSDLNNGLGTSQHQSSV